MDLLHATARFHRDFSVGGPACASFQRHVTFMEARRIMKTLTTEDLKKVQKAEEPFVLVNVLPAAKFAETEIPGAVSIPMDDPDFAERVSEMAGGKDRPVITYCASEECPASTDAARALEGVGFTDVYDYKAGSKGWREDSSATKRPEETPQAGKEHPAFSAT
jgi:rhodanese-related sulfurtransferase